MPDLKTTVDVIMLFGSAGETMGRCLMAARLAIGDGWFLDLPSHEASR